MKQHVFPNNLLKQFAAERRRKFSRSTQFFETTWNNQIFSLSITEQFHFLRKPVHPLPGLSRKMDGSSDALVNGHAGRAGDEVVRVRDDLLLDRPGHAVAGMEAEEGAFIRGQAGPGMALNDAGDRFGKAHGTKEIGTLLGMADRMGFAPADVVEQGTGLYKRIVNVRVPGCIFTSAVPDGPAVEDHLLTAPGVP
jgi:hypothetical protein